MSLVLGCSAPRTCYRVNPKIQREIFAYAPELKSFANGIEKDKAAVQADLTWSINNGPVEVHVNKLKLIKRTISTAHEEKC